MNVFPTRFYLVVNKLKIVFCCSANNQYWYWLFYQYLSRFSTHNCPHNIQLERKKKKKNAKQLLLRHYC